MINIDAILENADWTKQKWDLPPYKSKAFMEQLKFMGITLKKFKELPVYQFATQLGLIKNDKWDGEAI